MTWPLIALVGVIYLGVTVGFVRAGNYGMAAVFFGYALSNIGFIIATKQGMASGG